MNSAKIFYLNEKIDQIRTLEESGYLLEADLQALIALYPDLLAGDQIDPENPRRWLLVSREMGVPGGEYEGGRWSLDHLFIDQDGIPTFVECKRASDTRIRREVVAQMLEYAANGVEYWSVDLLRAQAADQGEDVGRTLDDAVAELLEEPDADVEGFWAEVAENLAAHRIRLLFAADQLPKELRRLIEFLNREMSRIEVLGLEIRQYQSEDGGKVLVPRIIGASESARTSKRSTSSSRKVTREEFMAACTPTAQRFFAEMLARAEQAGYIVVWGLRGFSVKAELRRGGGYVSILYGVPPDEMQFYFDSKGQLDRERSSPFRKELLASGLLVEKGNYTLGSIVDENTGQANLELLNFVLARIKRFETEGEM